MSADFLSFFIIIFFYPSVSRTRDDDLDEVAVLQPAALPQAQQQLLRGGLMSEQQDLLPRPHQAAVWGLQTGAESRAGVHFSFQMRLLNCKRATGCSGPS